MLDFVFACLWDLRELQSWRSQVRRSSCLASGLMMTLRWVAPLSAVIKKLRCALPVASAFCKQRAANKLTCFAMAQVNDISLEDYIAVKPKFAVYVPHTAGRYQKKRFRKAQCPIVERCAVRDWMRELRRLCAARQKRKLPASQRPCTGLLLAGAASLWPWPAAAGAELQTSVNVCDLCRLTASLMMHGRNNGKKLLAVRIVKHAFDIIHLLSDSNPIQVLVDAIINRCGWL